MADSGSKRNHRHSERRRQKSLIQRSRRLPRSPVKQPIVNTNGAIPDTVSPNIVLDDYPGCMDWEMAASEHPGSSDIGSCLDSGTDYAITDEAHSSWLLVNPRRRSYSNDSNRTSEGPCLSIPSDGKQEWTYGAVEAESAHPPIIEHDHQQILSDLSNPNSNNFYHSFRTSASISEEAAYHEHMENYSIQTADTSQATGFLSPFITHDGSEASWNPIQHRVTGYDPGYTVFAPLSPSDSLVNGTTTSPEDSKYLSPRKKDARTPKSVKPTKGKSKALTWEHTVVQKNGLARVFERPHVDSGTKPFGCRKGKLDPDTAARARIIRKLGACWSCWLVKVPCSNDEICNRCRKQISRGSPTAEQFCCRNGFVDYEETFFSGKIAYLHSHLQRSEIEKLMSEHTNRFTDDTLDVEVCTGRAFKPMKLLANLFLSKDNELLKQHHVNTSAEHPDSQLVCRDSAPIGLMVFSTSGMKELCKDHAEKMVKNPEYTLQTTAGDPNQISYLVLEAIQKYFFATTEPLLRKALMLHACHYFMGQLVTFTKESAELVHRKVNPYGMLQDEHFSSRLLNRQVKYAMHKLHQDIMRDLLEGLEKLMRSRTRDSWGPSFCIILVLCLCIDGLQTAADAFVIYDINKCKREGGASEHTRATSTAACQDLDEYPFRQCTKRFHDIYRSHRENVGAREGFNPLRTLHDEVTDGLDQPTVLLVRHIQWILEHHRPEMEALSRKSTMVDIGDGVQLEDIKANHCGRLASKFLLSFFPPQY